MKKLIITLVTLMILGLPSCGGKYTKSTFFYIGVQNSSDIKLSVLKIRASEYGTETPISQEWILTEKQFEAQGEVFNFKLRETMNNLANCTVQLFDELGAVTIDTVLALDTGVESNITYMLKYKTDKTLELETIISSL